MAPRKLLGKRLGRSVAKSHKTLTLDEVLEEPVVKVEKKKAEVVEEIDDSAFEVDPEVEAKVKASFQKEKLWLDIQVAYTQDRRVQILTEFIRSVGLFEELAKFAKKMKR